jgi:hypothetical protein
MTPLAGAVPPGRLTEQALSDLEDPLVPLTPPLVQKPSVRGHRPSVVLVSGAEPNRLEAALKRARARGALSKADPLALREQLGALLSAIARERLDDSKGGPGGAGERS